jgi:hypothetical protein
VTARRWVIQAPIGRPITMNKHRTLHHHERAKVDAAIREHWAWLAIRAKVPHLDRIRIEVTPLHKDGRAPQDVAACAPYEKAARDGLVDARVVVDDGPKYVLSCMFHAPRVCGVDGIELVVIDASEEET